MKAAGEIIGLAPETLLDWNPILKEEDSGNDIQEDPLKVWRLVQMETSHAEEITEEID